VKDLLAILAFWELDLPDFGCELMLDFHVKLLLRTLVPIAFLVILGSLAQGLKRFAPTSTATSKLRAFCGNAAFAIIFLCYPGCTAAVFATFNCESFDNGERYVKADYSIDCDSPMHRDYQAFAGVMFIWPVGVPLFYLIAYAHYHDRILASDHYAPAEQARRRSSAARRRGSEEEGQTLDLFTAASELATGGDVAGKSTKGLPASLVALISLYEIKFYW